MAIDRLFLVRTLPFAQLLQLGLDFVHFAAELFHLQIAAELFHLLAEFMDFRILTRSAGII